MTAEINEIFETSDGISLIKKFEARESGYFGKIELNCDPKDTLQFDVLIPITYPLLDGVAKSIKFFCTNEFNVVHINPDKSICLITPPSINFENRLKLEIDGLKEWSEKFYINGVKDEKYDLPIVINTSQSVYYFTDFDGVLSPNCFGYISFVKNGSDLKPTFYITQIDKYKTQFANVKSTCNNGMYYFLNKEPISGNRMVFRNWADFNSIINQKFKERLNELKVKRAKNKRLTILIGFMIPETNEKHWLAIETETKNIPIKRVKRAANYYEFEFMNAQIPWANTANISYNRFFGRGAFNTTLANSKILIIGCGAIGSSLAKVLVRSGCKDIDLSDFDIVEPGNICRSEFYLSQHRQSKFEALLMQLYMISPFYEGKFQFVTKDLSSLKMKANEVLLSKYDYIFDCSSDNELCFYLDKLAIKSTIINMSISNKAKDLVIVIGSRNILNTLNHLYEGLDKAEEELFFEGIGCWSPTFQASFFDINTLLNCALKNINYRLEKGLDLNSFIVKTAEKNGYLNLQIYDY